LAKIIGTKKCRRFLFKKATRNAAGSRAMSQFLQLKGVFFEDKNIAKLSHCPLALIPQVLVLADKI